MLGGVWCSAAGGQFWSARASSVAHGIVRVWRQSGDTTPAAVRPGPGGPRSGGGGHERAGQTRARRA